MHTKQTNVTVNVKDNRLVDGRANILVTARVQLVYLDNIWLHATPHSAYVLTPANPTVGALQFFPLCPNISKDSL